MSSECTVYVSSLDGRVTEELLWELFLQAGPLRSVKIPLDRTTGRNRSFAFITYRDECSVQYACELFNSIRLFQKPIYCKPQRDGKQDLSNSAGSVQGPSSPTCDWSRAANDSCDSFSTPSPVIPPGRSGRDFFDSRGYCVGIGERRDIGRGENLDLRKVLDGRQPSPLLDFAHQDRRHDEYRRYDVPLSDYRSQYDRNGQHGSHRNNVQHMNSSQMDSPNQMFTKVLSQALGPNLKRSHSYDDRFHGRETSSLGPIKSNLAHMHRDLRRQKPY